MGYNKPTLDQYIRMRMNWFDWVCMYSWVLFLVLFLVLAGLLAAEVPVHGGLWGLLFAIALVIVIVLRGIIFANRVRRWKDIHDML
jgi:O-antigen/teichoic acid export membrane protein